MALMATATCTPVSFSEYDDVNLIESRDLSSGTWTVDDGSFVPPGTGTYMTFDTPAAPPAPPAGVTDTVYRLEVKNQLNNGDFEGGNPFNNSGGAGSTVGLATNLDGDSMALDAPSGEYTYVDLAGNLADGFPANSRYAFHLDFTTVPESVSIELHDGAAEDTQNLFSISRPSSYGPTDVVYFTKDEITADPALATNGNEFTSDNGSSYTNFSFGGFADSLHTAQSGEVDNIRIARSDLSYYARLAVPVEDAGRPVLEDGGTYTVSVYVQPEAAADITPTTPNRYAARYLSLGINPSPGTTGTEAVERHNLSGLSAGSWTKLSTEVSGFQIDDSLSGTDTALEVVIEPTNSAGGPLYTDAGSILICGPELTWNPN